MPKETPLIKQYNSIKAKYPDSFLFFRLGDFYELFGDDAIKASRLMEVTLTKRQELPMCGVPYHSASNYIKKLLNHAQSIAICEQVEDPSQSKGIVKRDVVRVITPGTIIEDELLAGDSNNFIASVFTNNKADKWGIVFLDISTGDFMGTSLESRAGAESEISRFTVKEAVIPQDNEVLRSMFKSKFPEISLVEKDEWYFSISKAEETIKDYFELSTIKGWELDKNPAAARACGGILSYIDETGKGKKTAIKSFRLYSSAEYMVLDKNTQENLELLKNLQDNTKKNTLYEILDLTSTSMGKRKLSRWIVRPLKEKDKIRRRLNCVEEIKENRDLALNLKKILTTIADMERIISRSGFGSCNARDLLALKNSLKAIPKIKDLLKDSDSNILKDTVSGLDEMKELVNKLENSLREDSPMTIKEGGVIKTGYNADLDIIIEKASGDKEWIKNLQQSERKRLDIPSLKVGYNKVHGYYIEVTKTHTDKVPVEYTRKQTLVNAERYITPQLKERENSILGARDKRCALEYEIFISIRNSVCRQSPLIQKNAELIARLDVLTSFARISENSAYAKPRVGDWPDIDIKDGRHPVVEQSMGLNEFIPNDTYTSTDSDQVILITGPNMSGKSTYLKQVAVITIMAQMGCFVPAGSAKIGITDRIFTRIGAGENLAAGESTFMVEMTEVASILSAATQKSLLIMDEVGRGTSTFDGISIAWAVIEKISNIGSRTLFATHYFELTELASHMDKVKNYNFAVREWKDRKKIVFLRKLSEGSADKSYGIHCAELAGVPAEVISRAWEIFGSLEEGDNNKNISFRQPLEDRRRQLDLFNPSEEKYAQKIKNINLNNLKPLDLMNIIRDMQQDIEDEN
ncbi:MAG: DNA mismatch repair protein MutS [Elusimicrobiota bacterium]